MTILDYPQGSQEWITARLGLVTASEAEALITPKWKIKDLDDAGPRTYLFRKLAEAYLCQPVDQFSSFQTEQGTLLEPEAIPYFELMQGCDVDRVGFIIGDDRRSGCSPDGLIKCGICRGAGWTAQGSTNNPQQIQCNSCYGTGWTSGLELKCPQPANAVRYAMDGILPPDYELQVHFSMFVTGFPRWKFMSYHRRLPKLIIEVKRDEEKIAKIQSALDRFYNAFDEAWDDLNKRADEPRRNPFQP